MGPSFPLPKEAQPPHFRPMSIVAKLSPISATVEHLLCLSSSLCLSGRCDLEWSLSIFRKCCLIKRLFIIIKMKFVASIYLSEISSHMLPVCKYQKCTLNESKTLSTITFAFFIVVVCSQSFSVAKTHAATTQSNAATWNTLIIRTK